MRHITSASSENFSERGLGQSHREVLQFPVAYEKYLLQTPRFAGNIQIHCGVLQSVPY